MKLIQGKEDISYCFVWIWIALFSLLHGWIQFLCLLFHKELVAFENCKCRITADICHLRLINVISSIWINLSTSHCLSLTHSLSRSGCWPSLAFIAGLNAQHRNCFICRTNQVGDPLTLTQSVTVTSMHRATIFSNGHTLSWLTNLLRSTFSSLHCSTWLSVAVPRWTWLLPLLLKVAPLMPLKWDPTPY